MASHHHSLAVIDSGKRTSNEQMQHDADLLQGTAHTVLRFYGWHNLACTYGYFIDPERWIRKELIDCARRPTGGGLIFHQDDFSFTVALTAQHPIAQLPVLDRYQAINNIVVKSIQTLLPELDIQLQTGCLQDSIEEICMAHATKYDLMWQGKKVGGAAQRKNRQVLLHQSSLILNEPAWSEIEKILVEPDAVLPHLQKTTGALCKRGEVALTDFRQALKKHLEISLKKLLDEDFSLHRREDQ